MPTIEATKTKRKNYPEDRRAIIREHSCSQQIKGKKNQIKNKGGGWNV
jgi:hypothetical protein